MRDGVDSVIDDEAFDEQRIQPQDVVRDGTRLVHVVVVSNSVRRVLERQPHLCVKVLL